MRVLNCCTCWCAAGTCLTWLDIPRCWAAEWRPFIPPSMGAFWPEKAPVTLLTWRSWATAWSGETKYQILMSRRERSGKTIKRASWLTFILIHTGVRSEKNQVSLWVQAEPVCTKEHMQLIFAACWWKTAALAVCLSCDSHLNKDNVIRSLISQWCLLKMLLNSW